MKNKTIMLLIGLLGLVLLSGCQSRSEVLGEKFLCLGMEMTSVLEGVTDMESAKAAKPEYQRLNIQMTQIESEALDGGGLSEEGSLAVQERFKKKYGVSANRVWADLYKQLARIAQTPELANAAGINVGAPGQFKTMAEAYEQAAAQAGE